MLHPSSHRFFVSMNVTFHEIESFFGCPQLQGESLPEAESFIPKSFLPLLPTQELSPPSSSLSNFTQELSPPSGSPSNSIQESASSPAPPEPAKENTEVPLRVYHRRRKPKVVQQQLQESEPMVSTEGISSPILDNDPLNICEPNPDDLPIALRKEKRTYTKYPISQFVSSKHLSL